MSSAGKRVGASDDWFYVINVYLNEGHDVNSAAHMKEAME